MTKNGGVSSEMWREFFGVSNECAVNLSKCATGNLFHYPARVYVYPHQALQ